MLQHDQKKAGTFSYDSYLTRKKIVIFLGRRFAATRSKKWRELLVLIPMCRYEFYVHAHACRICTGASCTQTTLGTPILTLTFGKHDIAVEIEDGDAVKQRVMNEIST